MGATPFQESFRQPAEWDLHEACWVAWPSHGDLWQENLEPAREEWVALCRAITGVDSPFADRPVEKLEVLVPDATNLALAKEALKGLPARFHEIPFGDIWLRDTAPIFVSDLEGTVASVAFGFNGWGGKYDLPHDPEVSGRIAAAAGLRSFRFPWILEGGSVEVDGEGTCLTSRQCLLNANRNPKMSQASLEAGLKQSLGAEKVLWLGDGLLNDHTDGHIDTIARFVAPGRVVCMEADSDRDPNRAVMAAIVSDLASFTDARGRKLDVVRIPSPGKITDEDGRVMPASYLNFYIANRTVVVPTYGAPNDQAAVKAIAKLFPNRDTIGISAFSILSGGGAFHCITQQQPWGPK